MSQRLARLLAAVVVAAVVTGCVTITFDPEPTPTPTPEATSEIAAASPTPPASPTGTAAATPAPRLTPTPTSDLAAAGPPFPDRDPEVLVYDAANVFSTVTEGVATFHLKNLGHSQDATVIVYTQYKPEATFESTEQDAIALMEQWEIDNGLVMMWNTTRTECQRGVEGNGFVRMYATPDYSSDYLSQTQQQTIFDTEMIPWLRICDEDGALMGALNAIRNVGYRPPVATDPPATGDDACTDATYALAGWWWNEPYRWQFAEGSVPAEYDADAVRDVIERSVENITTARNDCGLPDNVAAEAEYGGVTEDEPCGDFADGSNVIGFGELPDNISPDTIAFTCPYGAGSNLEADIVINKDVAWALSEEDCFGFEELLETTMTHELGHVFGLDHVGERRHGYLTMSPRTNGPCTADEITLGLGDVRGLEELY